MEIETQAGDQRKPVWTTFAKKIMKNEGILCCFPFWLKTQTTGRKGAQTESKAFQVRSDDGKERVLKMCFIQVLPNDG